MSEAIMDLSFFNDIIERGLKFEISNRDFELSIAPPASWREHKKPSQYGLDQDFMTRIYVFDLKDFHSDIIEMMAELLAKLGGDGFEKFIRKEDRNKFIISHALTRIIAGGIAQKPPKTIDIKLQARGKPYFFNLPQLKFSRSYSGPYICITFSNVELGVDIEIEKPLGNLAELEDTCLSTTEKKYYEAGEEKKFLRIWTLKESILKAHGDGLYIDMADIHINKILFEQICSKQGGAIRSEQVFYLSFRPTPTTCLSATYLI